MSVPTTRAKASIPEAELRLRAQIAAHESWAQTPNRAARTAPARAASAARFLAMANGDPEQAEHFRKAHYARMALKSAQARRKARELTAAAEAAESELADLGGQCA